MPLEGLARDGPRALEVGLRHAVGFGLKLYGKKKKDENTIERRKLKKLA